MVNKPASANLHSGPGFRVHEVIVRPDISLCNDFLHFETPDISDQLNRLYTLSQDIHNVVNNASIAGPAVTIKVFPGDNLMVHKAIDVIMPGDILVIDAGGSTTNAVIGDMIATKARHRGAVGVIVDGLVRDLPALRKVGLPVFAKGVSPIGPLHRGPGELNFTVSCGGIVVNPGDIIVADDTGAVVVRQDFAEELLQRLQAKKKAMIEYEAAVKRGNFSNEWVERILADSKCHKQS